MDLFLSSVNGVKRLFRAITSFTGAPNQIIATGSDGKIDLSLLPNNQASIFGEPVANGELAIYRDGNIITDSKLAFNPDRGSFSIRGDSDNSGDVVSIDSNNASARLLSFQNNSTIRGGFANINFQGDRHVAQFSINPNGRLDYANYAGITNTRQKYQIDSVDLNINHLSDVDTESDNLAPGDILRWDGTTWTPSQAKRCWSFSVAINNRSVSNAWLRREGSIATDKCPYICPSDCLLHTVTVSGSPDEIDDYDFQIYRNGSLFQSYRKLRNARYAVYKNLTISFNEGDRISIRAARVLGGNVAYPGGTLYFEQL